ncbi:putative undecaprenyl diphosphate synthase-domain-containing protein [Aspergillus carlsbadensis]|nr:putative undecaprenyl diphosphate synthase-domain-containing protein [Aspergillus carlsbadensis]
MPLSLSWPKPSGPGFKTQIEPRIKHFLLDVLGTGPVPQHVAFIMDGNRRYAKSKKISTVEGYLLGGVVLVQTVNACFIYGIKAVTVYAFSIENFKRPKAEVDAIMGLAVQHMSTIIEQISQQGHRTKVQILGRLDLFPENVQQSVRRLVVRTSHHTETTVNFCVGYTAREEITAAMRRTVADCTLTSRNSSRSSRSTARTGMGPESNPISAHTLSENMYTAGCPPLDLIIRTSGERRLSDFLLWQCNRDNSEIVVVRCFWPEFGFLELFWVFLGWQRRQRGGRWGPLSSKGGSSASDGVTLDSVLQGRTRVWVIAFSLLVMCLVLDCLC